MVFSKIKNLSKQAKEQASSGLDAAKSFILDSAEAVKENVGSFSLEDITNRMSTCQQYFSDSELLQKLTKVAKSAGAGLIYPVLLLFNMLKSAEVNNSQKMMILGALGYFILPLDLIPDVVPIQGFADDLSAALFALKGCVSTLSAPIQEESKVQLKKWLGEYDPSLTKAVDKMIKEKTE